MAGRQFRKRRRQKRLIVPLGRSDDHAQQYVVIGVGGPHRLYSRKLIPAAKGARAECFFVPRSARTGPSGSRAVCFIFGLAQATMVVASTATRKRPSWIQQVSGEQSRLSEAPTPAVSLCFNVSDTAVITLGQSHYISVSIARDLKQFTQVPQGKYASFRLYDALALPNAAGAVVDPVAGRRAVAWPS